MGLRLTVAPTSEPITRAEAKAFAKVDVTDDDSLIDALITAARQLVETEQNRQLMPATYELTLDEFPSSSNCPIELPRPRRFEMLGGEYVGRVRNRIWELISMEVT